MKRGTPRHPKVQNLVEELGERRYPLPYVVGMLELLWHFTAEFAPQGDIGKYSVDRIEAAIGWTGRRGRALEALTKCGWCDVDVHGLYTVHAWEEHADDTTRRKLAKAGLCFLPDRGKTTDINPPACALPTPVPEPKPEPLPTAEPPATAVSPPYAIRPHAEFPETAIAIREKWPATDDVFVMRLADAVAQTTISANISEAPEDSLIAAAVRECSKAPKQTGAGLYLRTVPQCVKTWMTQGRTAIPRQTVLSERSVKALEFGMAVERRMQNAKTR